MSDDRRCPCCGYLWDVPNVHGREDFTTDLVESMGREIRYLRETVAKLRGAYAVRSIPSARQAAAAGSPGGIGREAAHEAAT
jgi:hypothetical protein